MVKRSKVEGLTPEAAKALADKAIETTVVPKKIPAADDIEGQVKTIVGALSSAMLTATEMPVQVPPAVLGAVAEQLVAYGVRQTEHIDPAAVYAPAWITDGVKQHSVKLPEQPAHTEAEPVVERTATAPSCPKRVGKAARAVRQ